VLWHWTAVFLEDCKARLASIIARRRSKPAKSAIPRFDKSPVQTELSLDQIRVLRNDLRDADLEVVAARPPTPAAAPAKPAEVKPAVAETAWGRVTNRIVGASKS
jgi:hypothetical protein